MATGRSEKNRRKAVRNIDNTTQRSSVRGFKTAGIGSARTSANPEKARQEINKSTPSSSGASAAREARNLQSAIRTAGSSAGSSGASRARQARSTRSAVGAASGSGSSSGSSRARQARNTRSALRTAGSSAGSSGASKARQARSTRSAVSTASKSAGATGAARARRARDLRSAIDPAGQGVKTGKRFSTSARLNSRRNSGGSVNFAESAARKIHDAVSPPKHTATPSGKRARMSRGVSNRDKLEASANKLRSNTAYKAARFIDNTSDTASEKFKSARKGYDKFSENAQSTFGSFVDSGSDAFDTFVNKADKLADEAIDEVGNKAEMTAKQLEAAMKNLKKAWAANKK